MCSQITWKSCEKADSVSGGLEWGPESLLSQQLQVMQVQSDLYTFLLESLGFPGDFIDYIVFKYTLEITFIEDQIWSFFSPILIWEKLHWFPLYYLLNSNEISIQLAFHMVHGLDLH